MAAARNCCLLQAAVGSGGEDANLSAVMSRAMVCPISRQVIAWHDRKVVHLVRVVVMHDDLPQACFHSEAYGIPMCSNILGSPPQRLLKGRGGAQLLLNCFNCPKHFVSTAPVYLVSQPVKHYSIDALAAVCNRLHFIVVKRITLNAILSCNVEG